MPCPPSPSTYAARRPRTAGVGTEFGASVSGSAAVLVDEAAEHIDPLDRPRAEGNLIGHRGDFEAEPAVGVSGATVNDDGGVTFVEDEIGQDANDPTPAAGRGIAL